MTTETAQQTYAVYRSERQAGDHHRLCHEEHRPFVLVINRGKYASVTSSMAVPPWVHPAPKLPERVNEAVGALLNEYIDKPGHSRMAEIFWGSRWHNAQGIARGYGEELAGKLYELLDGVMRGWRESYPQQQRWFE